MRVLKTLLIVLVLGAGLVACDETPDHRERDQEFQNANQERMTQQYPIPQIENAPTRQTIIKWIERWDAQDKVAFIYLLANNGQKIGYYVSQGLPVSYCTSLTPPEQVLNRTDSDFLISAPALDGVYYNGGDCNHWYFFEAQTDAYIEFGGQAGMFYVSDQPLPIDVEPLGTTRIEDVDA